MNHGIYSVTAFERLGPYELRVNFDDQTSQVIDFRPVLEGELYGPLQDLALFDQVAIDPEVRTLVWPNGADFDPATLHDWPLLRDSMLAFARMIGRGLADSEAGRTISGEEMAKRISSRFLSGS